MSGVISQYRDVNGSLLAFPADPTIDLVRSDGTIALRPQHQGRRQVTRLEVLWSPGGDIAPREVKQKYQRYERVGFSTTAGSVLRLFSRRDPSSGLWDEVLVDTFLDEPDPWPRYVRRGRTVPGGGATDLVAAELVDNEWVPAVGYVPF